VTLTEWVPRVVWARQGWEGRIAYALLRPLSLLFAAGVALRDLGYRFGLLPVHHAPVPVVSVGNLVVGGTGKTPFTLWLARALGERGIAVGILLRGYGGTASGTSVVSRGDGPELDAEKVGDEAVMLAKSFTGPVVTSARRIAGAEILAGLGCRLILLDDGFQHRAIARVFDVVLFDGRRGPLLPAGPLREGMGALCRADAVVLVERAGGGPPVDAPVTGKPLFRVFSRPVALVEAVGRQWRELPLGGLAGKRVVAVAGIARPEGFYQLLRDWGAEIDEVFEFADHHRYTSADWQSIARCGHQADLVVTTEKDLVKLEAFPFATGKLVALRIAPVVDRADELIGSILKAAGAGVGRGGTD
jgi:tetraacyldisaccharide 4'-kinase